MAESDDFDNYQELSEYSLDSDREQELLDRHKECTFIWTNKAGEPVGMVMTYLAAKGKIWMMTTESKQRIAAVRRDPRSCVVISSAGLSDWGTGKTVTYKGTTRVLAHDAPEVAGWMFRDYVTKLNRLAHGNVSGVFSGNSGEGDAERIDFFVEVLDIPERVVLEFTPEKRISYDGDKMAALTPGASGQFDDMFK